MKATDETIRRAIQSSDASIRSLAKSFGVNPKTVAKWKRRRSLADRPSGSRKARATRLSAAQEARVIAFRRYTLLPIDDCLYALRISIPQLSRSTLHRCLQRNGLSRLPQWYERQGARPLGFFYAEIREIQTDEGCCHLFMATDRLSKFVHADFYDQAGSMAAASFLESLVATVPYRIYFILTEERAAFDTAFTGQCADLGIDHRIAKPNQSWSPRQTAPLDKAFDDTASARIHVNTREQSQRELRSFLRVYNYATRLKTLHGLAPHDYIRKIWSMQPSLFHKEPVKA